MKSQLVKNSAILFLGVLVGLVSYKLFLSAPSIVIEGSQKTTTESREGGGKFTNPLLECKQEELDFTELRPFKDKIEKLVHQLEGRNDVDTIAVYFRDLNNGPWFGIDEQAEFAPASLLKLPLAIAYYKLAEQDPTLLTKELIFTDPGVGSTITQTVVPKETLEIGKSYTVEDLIFRMLAYSDNNAYSLLLDNIKFEELATIYKDFGFNLNELKKTEEIVNVQNYSGFLRILYNASYLNKENSEKILSELAASDFNQGLVAGVPSGTSIAHKFGERGQAGSNKAQFSDCGILYYSQRPYLLCVMTKGSNSQNQIQSIQKISSSVYEEVSKNK